MLILALALALISLAEKTRYLLLQLSPRIFYQIWLLPYKKIHENLGNQ
jgi:hypothetical protein